MSHQLNQDDSQSERISEGTWNSLEPPCSSIHWLSVWMMTELNQAIWSICFSVTGQWEVPPMASSPSDLSQTPPIHHSHKILQDAFLSFLTLACMLLIIDNSRIWTKVSGQAFSGQVSSSDTSISWFTTPPAHHPFPNQHSWKKNLTYTTTSIHGSQ